MTVSKKKAQRQAGRKPAGKPRGAADIEARARAILANPTAYDADTRRAILRAYETKGEDLAELVKRAEAGEMICDLIGVSEDIAEAAKTTVRLMELPGLPDFLRSAVIDVVNHASRVENVETWVPVGEDSPGYSAARLAELFGCVGLGYRADLAMEPKQDLAGLLAAVLSHPDTPPVVFEAVTEGLGDLYIRTEIWKDADTLRALFNLGADEKGGK
jgi:hypothetical protein